MTSVETEPDPVVVDALVQRFPVPGASPADRRAAGLILLARGWSTEDIGVLLRVQRDTVNKWVEREREKRRRANEC